MAMDTETEALWDEANVGDEFDLELVMELRKMLFEGRDDFLLEGSDASSESEVQSVDTAMLSEVLRAPEERRQRTLSKKVKQDILHDMKKVIHEVEVEDDSLSCLGDEEKMSLYSSAWQHTVDHHLRGGGVGTIVIKVYRNADRHHRGVAIPLTPGTFKSLEQLLRFITDRVRLPTGPCRRLHAVSNGEVVTSIANLMHHGRYVACGTESMDLDNLATAALGPWEDSVESQEEEKGKKHAPSAEEVFVRAVRDYKPVGKFGTQAVKAPTIHLFLNKSRHDTGHSLVINPKLFKTWAQVLEKITKTTRPPAGAVRKLYTSKGKLMRAIEQLEDQVGIMKEKEKKTELPRAMEEKMKEIAERKQGPKSSQISRRTTAPVGVKDAALRRRRSLEGASASNGRIRRGESHTAKPIPAKKSGWGASVGAGGLGLANPPVRIRVFRNGDHYHRGDEMIIRPQTIKTWQQLLQHITSVIKPPTGAAKRLYTVEGKRIGDLVDLEDGSEYIACGGEPLKKRR